MGVPRAEHVDGTAHVRADGWRGITAGPGAWPGLDQRTIDADGRDASLPTARHVISNLESWAAGTFHGLSATRAAVLRGRPLLEVLASRVRCHHGPGRRLLPGVLPPRPAARGGLPPAAPRPVRPGASGRRGEYR